MARVLVVDDDAGLRALERTVLETEGHEVEEAANGAEALAILERETNRPDLVLLDIMMPVMDGWSLLLALHEKEIRRRTRVVVVSALSDGASRLRSRRAGALGHVGKPFDADELVATVRSVLAEPAEELCERNERLDTLARLIDTLDGPG